MSELVFGVTDTTRDDFRSWEEYSWPELEREVGLAFTEDQRKEIFHARDVYLDHLAAAEQAVNVKDIKKLKREMIKASNAFLVFKYNDADSKDELLHHLSWMQGGDLRSKYYTACEAVFEFLNTLVVEADGFAPTQDIKKPKVYALKHYLAWVRGTSEHGTQMRGDYWGVGVSAGSNVLLRLTSFLTDRTDLIESDIRNAINSLRRDKKNRVG